jgi:hypothetical protein
LPLWAVHKIKESGFSWGYLFDFNGKYRIIALGCKLMQGGNSGLVHSLEITAAKIADTE